ncbi:hypothetical protein HMN09_00813200 [Mycena chlorophos]|uniref:DUF6533 domain-containing protein n=1 Tax=Mycena chlorophos TaxID=658473 RepID=A0A8H6ST27_MYCCL|nr:hypothetical protein HMN09_00813200 [Mycena chlorophos]
MSDAESVLEARLIPSTLVACCVVLAYDWFLTLDREISAIWSNPRSIGTVVFLVNRYLPFVDILVSTTSRFQFLSPESCLVRNKFVGWMSLIGICISEGILLLRTYAIWGRSRTVLIILCAVWACTVIPALVVTQIELASLVYVPADGVGCELAQAGSIIIFAYILLMLSETTIVILTALRAYRDLRNQNLHRGWLIQLYKDGLFFYFYLLAISIANVLVPILGPEYMANWLASPQRVLHSVLTTRVLLLIRGQVAAARSGFQDADRDLGMTTSDGTRERTGLAFADMPSLGETSELSVEGSLVRGEDLEAARESIFTPVTKR